MGGPHLAGPPQLGQLRQELIETFPSGPLRGTVTGYQGCQGRLALANTMQQAHGIELRPLRSQLGLDFVIYGGMPQQPRARRGGGFIQTRFSNRRHYYDSATCS